MLKWLRQTWCYLMTGHIYIHYGNSLRCHECGHWNLFLEMDKYSAND